MKINEIIESNVLYGEAAVKWLLNNCFINGIGHNPDAITLDPIENTLAIDGNVSLNFAPHESKLRAKIDYVEGDFSVERMGHLITTCQNFPEEVSGGVILNDSDVKSLKGISACRNVNLYRCNNLTNVRDIFPYIRPFPNMNSVILEGCKKLADIRGIEDLLEYNVNVIYFDSELEYTGGIGLINSTKIKRVWVSNQDGRNITAFSIIDKYLGKPDSLFECQAELIDAGFEKMAQL